MKRPWSWVEHQGIEDDRRKRELLIDIMQSDRLDWGALWHSAVLDQYRSANKMAKKRDRGFFVCPRWQEVLDAAAKQASGVSIDLELSPKTLTAIESGRPLARSTLRKALFSVRRVSGSMFDVDEFIEDQRVDRLPN